MASESYVSRDLLLVWLLLIATVIATFTIQRFKFKHLPPSGAAMVIGIAAGLIVRLAGAPPLQFSPAAFFYGLLPPIVFAAGFTLKKKPFFKNIGTILSYAVGGTILSTLVFSLLTWLLVLVGIVKRAHLGSSPLLSCLLYGSLISATDPVATLSVFAEADVPPLLFNLVAGESMFNDAVAIVLFRTLEEFYLTPIGWETLPQMGLRFVVISAGSLAVGIGVACACAFVLRRFAANFGLGGSDAHVYEMSLIILASYLAYLAAEATGMSGIAAIFFSGLCHAHYSMYSVSANAQISLKLFFETASFLSETFVFAYLGIAAASLGSNVLDWGLLVSGVPFVIISRAANIFPVSAAVNRGRTVPLPPPLVTMMWAAGLRGAVAYGLALNLPTSSTDPGSGIPAIESATLVVVLVTTLAFGGATGPLLRYLGLEGVSDQDVAVMGLQSVHPGLSQEEAVQRLTELQGAEKGTLRRAWKALDRDHLKPLLGGRQAAGAAGSAGNTQGTEYEPLASVGYDAARPTEVQLEGSHAEGLQPGSDPHWPDR